MSRAPNVLGLDQLKLNLKKRRADLAPAVARGLKLAGLVLQRESQLIVPVDTGNLKASAFTRASGKGFDAVVNVGYTAAYAMYVHENVEMKLKGQPRRPPAKGNYWDPPGRGQAKFLEAPARNPATRAAMLAAARNEIKRGKEGR